MGRRIRVSMGVCITFVEDGWARFCRLIGQLYPNAKIVQWSVRWMGAVCRKNGYRLFFFCCYSLLEPGYLLFRLR